MTKRFLVRIGDIARTGFEEVVDAFLFPTTLSTGEEERLINEILDEIETEEKDGRPD